MPREINLTNIETSPALLPNQTVFNKNISINIPQLYTRNIPSNCTMIPDPTFVALVQTLPNVYQPRPRRIRLDSVSSKRTRQSGARNDTPAFSNLYFTASTITLLRIHNTKTCLPVLLKNSSNIFLSAFAAVGCR